VEFTLNSLLCNKVFSLKQIFLSSVIVVATSLFEKSSRIREGERVICVFGMEFIKVQPIVERQGLLMLLGQREPEVINVQRCLCIKVVILRRQKLCQLE